MKLVAREFFELLTRAKSLRRDAAYSVTLALFGSATEIAIVFSLVPIMASLGVDAGTEISKLAAILPPSGWLAGFVVLSILRSTLNWLSAIHEEQVTQDLVISLQSRLYRALAGAHWDTVRRISPPVITSALQTKAYEAGYGFSSAIQIISASLLVIGYLVSASLVFPIAVPVLLILLLVMWRLNARSSDRVAAHAEEYLEAQTDLHQRYEDWVAISRIAALGPDSRQLADRFDDDAKRTASHVVGFARSHALTRASYEAAVVAAILIGVPVAWFLASPPALLAFGLVLIVRVLPRAGAIHNSYLGVINAMAPIRAIDRLANQLESDPARDSESLEPIEWKTLELVGVGIEDNLRDESEHWILQDVALQLTHGEWLGLKGPTGAGKTTLADVMLMLLRPDSGEICIDGHEIDETVAGRWRNQAAYVPQDVVLFDATIRDNLLMHAHNADDKELEVALRQAAGDFVVDRLPEGLDTRVGPGGHWLSGGERQRIGIARALLKKPGLLVLDEPTAALDTETQSKLMDALGKLEHEMSVVLITHRPELLKLADRVIEIENGRIVSRPQGGLPQGSR